MGWSTELFCNISFNRKSYNSLHEVEEDIEEAKRGVASCKETLRNLALITEPEKFYDKEEFNSPIAWVEESLSSSLELLEEYYRELERLEILKDNWDNCHDEKGLAINPPDNINWDTAFLEGDFVKSINNQDISKTLK